MPKVAKTKKQLEQENEELKAALTGQSAVGEELSRVYPQPIMVPVKNFSTNFIVHEYEYRGQKKRLELDISGRKASGAVPLEIWVDIERDTPFVREGFIARTDQPITNPNVIEDPEKLIENLTEEQIKDRVEQMTNTSSIFKLVGYIEPIQNKNGKLLAAQKIIRDRVFELTKTRIIDME